MGANYLTQTRIVRTNGRVAIHRVHVDPKTSKVIWVAPEPITLTVPDDGTSTVHLDLIDTLMDALAAHRSAPIRENGAFALRECA